MTKKRNDGLKDPCGLARMAAIGLLALTASLALADEELGDWSKRMPITFSGYEGAETLTNFPALVVLCNTPAGVGFDYADFQSPPYGDLRFAAGDKTTPLDFEVDAWDTNGLSYVWVRVPELTADTTIYALWGKAGVTPPACTTNGAVWGVLYKGVWHLGDQAISTTNVFCDATTNASHGLGVVSAAGRDGVVGTGQAFDGTDDLITTPVFTSSVQNAFTWTFWLKPTASHGIDAENNNSTLGIAGQKYALGAANYSTSAGMGVSAGNNGISVYEHANAYMPAVAVWQGSVTSWRHAAVVYTARKPVIYVDGVAVRTGVTSAKTTVHPSHQIGGGSYGNFSGSLDELRLADVPLSSDRIRAEYLNAASNGFFVVQADPESQGPPSVSNAGTATNVTSTAAWLNGTLGSTGTSATAVFAFSGARTAARTWGIGRARTCGRLLNCRAALQPM